MISCAKINLDLNILYRRDDGYHEIRSIFIPLKWGDEIEFFDSDDFVLVSTVSAELPNSNDFLQVSENGDIKKNILHKVFTQSKMRGCKKKGVRIILKKNIPTGGGLGGGSSNAASLLRFLFPNESLEPSEDFLKFASRLGADIPFFLFGHPAIIEGIGEKITPFKIARGSGVLAIPPFGISTRDAFMGLKKPLQEPIHSEHGRYPSSDLEDTLIKGKWKNLNGLVKNDFEPITLKSFPELVRLKDFMYEVGMEFVTMTGSGSTFFGLSSEVFKIKEFVSILKIKFPNFYFVPFEF